MVQAIQNVIAETTRYMDEYSELVKSVSEEKCAIIRQMIEIVVEA